MTANRSRASCAGGGPQRSEWRAPRRARHASRPMLRLYRFPYSTNVERVALALAHKGARGRVRGGRPRRPVRRCARSAARTSCPVLVDGERVIADSTRILHHLEERFPEPPLFPADAGRPRRGRRVPRLVQPRLEARAEPDRGRARARRRRPRGRRSLERPAAAAARPVRGAADRPRPPVRRVRRGRLRRVAVPALRRARSTPDDDELFHRVLHERDDARRTGTPACAPGSHAWARALG